MTVLQILERRGVTTAKWMIWSGERGWREIAVHESSLHRELRGRSPVLTARHEVWERLSHYRELPRTSVVTVGLGGLTGSMLIGPLVEQLTDVSTVHVVATTPLRFEGRERASRAEDALWAIRQSDAGYTVFDLERAKDEMQPLGRYGDFLKAVDRWLADSAGTPIARRAGRAAPSGQRSVSRPTWDDAGTRFGREVESIHAGGAESVPGRRAPNRESPGAGQRSSTAARRQAERTRRNRGR
jgi:hypothetical protein